MMTSEQLKAFDVSQEPASVVAEYGDTPFGRGCLAARRLIEVGVRCVEVTLDGWDSHVNNHEIHRKLVKQLDPAFAALLRDLERARAARPDDRPLLRRVRPDAQDQPAAAAATTGPPASAWPWPAAACAAAWRSARPTPRASKEPVQPTTVEDVHATVLKALGLDPAKENIAPATGRPIKLSAGQADPRSCWGDRPTQTRRATDDPRASGATPSVSKPTGYRDSSQRPLLNPQDFRSLPRQCSRSASISSRNRQAMPDGTR